MSSVKFTKKEKRDLYTHYNNLEDLDETQEELRNFIINALMGDLLDGGERFEQLSHDAQIATYSHYN
jgi:hypothetical protein